MTQTGTNDGTTVVKQEPTKATYQRTAVVSVGGIVSTAALTLIIAYAFLLYADAHPGFRTPAEAMGAEAGAGVYGGIAGVVTGIWQGIASFVMRGSKIVLHKYFPDESV